MRKLLAIALLLVCYPTWAALSNALINTGLSGTTPLTSGSFSATAGQDIEVETGTPANPSSGTPTSANVVITDSVDGTNFVNCGFIWNAANGGFSSVYHHQAVTGGARTFTITTTVVTFSQANWIVTTGFTGIATCDSTLNVTNFSTTTVASASFTPAATGHNNEIAIYSILGSSFLPSPPTGYTNVAGNGPSTGFNIQATSGTSVAISAATWNASATYEGVLNGIYDAASAPPTTANFFLVQ